MKNLKLYLLPFLAAAALASCEKEPDGGNTPEAKQLTIVASVDGTVIPEWKADDEIKVVCADELYTFTADKAGKTANFTEEEGTLTSDMVGNNPIAAFYNCTNMYGSFRIQAEQTYKDGASSAVIPAYAYTMNAPQDNMLALAFKPLASVLNLTVAPYNITVEKIIIAPAENAKISEGALAGGFTADAAQGNVKVNNELNTVTVTLDTPADITSGATFNIPLGWFSIEGGLTITMVYEGTKEYPLTIWADAGVVKSYNDEGGLKSAKMIAETFEFDANSFPRNWYVKADATAASKGISWETATSLTNALETALPGSVLHLAAGTYVPESQLTVMEGETQAAANDAFRSFIVEKNITIIGGYPANAATGAVADAANNATVLDGQNKVYHTMVVGAPRVSGEKVVLEGITIKGGSNSDAQKALIITYNEHNVLGDYAGGLSIAGSAVDMKNVKITDNTAYNAAGLYCIGGELNISDCVISGNTSGGNGGSAWITSGSKLNMSKCTITKNTAGGICAGLYLYVPEGKSLEAEITDSHFDENTAVSNAGGGYVRDDSGAHLLKASFKNCTFDNNKGAMGACVLMANCKTTFTGCSFSNNTATNNGVIYANTSGAGSLDVTLDGCVANGNSGTNGNIYLYNNGSGTFNFTILNSLMSGNKLTGRGGAIYARNAKTGAYTLNCVNCTMTGNEAAGLGSAVNMYGAADKAVTTNIISCTITGNTSTNATKIGAVTFETVGVTLNTYNTIVSGNKTGEGAACNIVEVKTATGKSVKYSFDGADYYGADGAVTAVTPAFDFATMLGSLGTDGTIKLVGDASTNPAFGNGMTATALKALANDYISADVLGKDQVGTTRNDTDKIVGACVKK